MIAEPFVPAKQGKPQRQQEIDHPQPRKQDVKKAKCKINNRPDP